MPHQAPRTKLIATLGPASASRERLSAMLDDGVDVCRLNFSHGTLDDHAAMLKLVRELAAEKRLPVAVMGDLCGPKIRLNKVPDGPLMLETGRTVQFVRGDEPCTADCLTTTLADFVDEVGVGNRIYIDDGLVRLLVTDRDEQRLTCTVTVAGEISSRKGVNLPDTALTAPALTDKDRVDLKWAIEHGVDYIALSFVRRPADVCALREAIDALDGDVGVVLKIEKVEALEHLDELVTAADGILVARGDLGVEMDVWQVPLIQKAITARCREAGVPVIIATQMLQSMVDNPMPTRAEVSDVANAIIDAADAVMLSAETAAGHYPVRAVDMMTKVAQVTESYATHGPGAATGYIAHKHHVADPADLHRQRSGGAAQPAPAPRRESVSARHPITSAIAHAAVQAARDLDARLVAAWTATGTTVRLVSGHRLPIPVVGLTYNERVCRRLNLLYGVLPILVEPISNPAEMAEVLDTELLSRGLAEPGDLIVVVTSTQPREPGRTDSTLVHRVRG